MYYPYQYSARFVHSNFDKRMFLIQQTCFSNIICTIYNTSGVAYKLQLIMTILFIFLVIHMAMNVIAQPCHCDSCVQCGLIVWLHDQSIEPIIRNPGFKMQSMLSTLVHPHYWGVHYFIKWKHKGQWHDALMYSLICAWINSQVNNREAGDLRSGYPSVQRSYRAKIIY